MATPPRNRIPGARPKPARAPAKPIAPRAVIKRLERHILVDGFKLVIDLERSHGSRLVDARSGREVLDLYSFFASMPVGYNHPWFKRREVEAELLAAARLKVASADVY